MRARVILVELQRIAEGKGIKRSDHELAQLVRALPFTLQFAEDGTFLESDPSFDELAKGFTNPAAKGRGNAYPETMNALIQRSDVAPGVVYSLVSRPNLAEMALLRTTVLPAQHEVHRDTLDATLAAALASAHTRSTALNELLTFLYKPDEQSEREVEALANWDGDDQPPPLKRHRATTHDVIDLTRDDDVRGGGRRRKRSKSTRRRSRRYIRRSR